MLFCYRLHLRSTYITSVTVGKIPVAAFLALFDFLNMMKKVAFLDETFENL